jgi:enoyl-CoA hydratase/carnithine racemase
MERTHDSAMGITGLSLNRAPVNAFNMDYIHDFNKAIRDCEREKDVKDIIFASSNKIIFSAGLDLTELYQKDNLYLRKF